MRSGFEFEDDFVEFEFESQSFEYEFRSSQISSLSVRVIRYPCATE